MVPFMYVNWLQYNHVNHQNCAGGMKVNPGMQRFSKQFQYVKTFIYPNKIVSQSYGCAV